MNLVVVTFKVSTEELELMDAIARKLGISRSELIRRSITAYIAGLKDGNPQITVRQVVLR